MYEEDTQELEQEELQEEEQDDTQETPETDETETEGQDDSESDDQEEEEENVLLFEDQEMERPGENESVTFKELRKRQKSTAKENRELKKRIAELEGTKQTNNQVPKLRKKPTITDHDYDYDNYDQDLEKWYNEKEQVNKAKEKLERQQAEANEKFNERLSSYNKKKKELGFKDFDDAEEIVGSALKPEMHGALLDVLDNPHLVVYHLGSNPEKLQQFAELAKSNPARFIADVAKLETKLKIGTRKKPITKPEKKPNGTSGTAIGVQRQLEKLKAEAARTGNRSALRQFRKKHNLNIE